VPGTTTVAKLSPHSKIAARIILKANGLGLCIAAGISHPGYLILHFLAASTAY